MSGIWGENSAFSISERKRPILSKIDTLSTVDGSA